MTTLGTRSPCGLNPFPMVFMRYSRIRHITDHVNASQVSGRPSLLDRTVSPVQIATNRAVAMVACAMGATLLPDAGSSCDEYPFASTVQGGVGASVRKVPLVEQFSQGGTLSIFYSLCGIFPSVPGLDEFLVVPVLAAPRSFSCGMFTR
jgi:hypothetical protein